MSNSFFLMFINTVTLSIALFSANLLLSRTEKHHGDIALVTCLVSIAFVLSRSTLSDVSPYFAVNLLIFTLPTMFLIGPSFWCYVLSMTSKSNWLFRRHHLKHFSLALLGWCIATTTLFLPDEIKHHLLIQGTDQYIPTYSTPMQYLVYCLVLSTFMLVLFWAVQTAYYYVKIIKRLRQYRFYLKEIFSSKDTKELYWLSFILLSIGILWLLATINITLSNLGNAAPVNDAVFSIIGLIMTWILAQWGLRQKPGFEELYQTTQGKQHLQTANKYQHSALDQTRAQHIASQIEKAMKEDKLYLDAALSLPKLAKHISTSANYISQTLNQNLSTSFFDYVNHHRIEAAKRLLTNTEETVLDIAMQVGFNAKSSFYTAFKKETQMTPSQYRKTHLNS
ncbi:helix-turn-helix domain-containing protein [Thalassotalea marina]|uniref:helix-turn-helix domain-containing protein n=1 Tax=Thalassotalea marina TaxID=1673741 RepID=UPI0016744018|nr:helix-turn-helix transcriptional regulator [Thalassotalea marina]